MYFVFSITIFDPHGWSLLSRVLSIVGLIDVCLHANEHTLAKKLIKAVDKICIIDYNKYRKHVGINYCKQIRRGSK